VSALTRGVADQPLAAVAAAAEDAAALEALSARNAAAVSTSIGRRARIECAADFTRKARLVAAFAGDALEIRAARALSEPFA